LRRRIPVKVSVVMAHPSAAVVHLPCYLGAVLLYSTDQIVERLRDFLQVRYVRAPVIHLYAC
jgi:hypothetical protein